MVLLTKIDSNATGLRFAEEVTIGVLPGSPIWNPLEPNSYDNFGGEISTVARDPINAGRQRQKGVTIDLDAAGGFETDLTQNNIADLMQGFFFADFRRKGEETPTEATGTTDLFDVAATAGFKVNDIIEVNGFVNTANNGIHIVTAIVADTTVEVLGSTLITETPPATATMVVVGHQGAAGDIDVDAASDLPALTASSLDFTTLGLIPGEFIFVGGDNAAEAFVDANNNGFMRIKTITATRLEIDKASGTMITEASTTETIQLFFGRVLKNESDPLLQVRRTYQLERELGAPDDALPSEIQGEYITGAVPSELTFNFATADKITVNMSFIGLDHETVTGGDGLKTGARPSIASEDAYNTTNDFTRLKMNIIDTASENPSALFAFLTEFTIAINNNVSPNKAIATLGGFEVTAGQFAVEGTATAYFSDVTAVAAVRNNSDVTMDFAIVKSNTGIVVDVPLMSLGDGRLNIEQNEPIQLPLELGAGADRVFNHTLLMVFFDFLPNAADV